MAIFRAETKSISRGKGHNLVAALSYRAGMVLTDTNEFNPNATTHDYTKKTDVVHREILIPKALKKKLDDADITLDFQYVANLVETSETTLRGKMKKNARLGREWVLCGVPELSRAENIQLFQQFAKEQGEEQGVISMCFVHDPKAGNDTRSKLSTPSDERNIHAHIVLLTRKVELTKANTLKLGDKSDSELSNEERTDGKICAETGKVLVKGKGLVSNRQWVKDVRKSWADILNEKLLEKGVQPVTHKSYRELGVDIVPTVHVGNNELSEGKRLQNERINKRNKSVIESSADSGIDREQRAAATDDKRFGQTTLIISRTRARISEASIILERNAPSSFDTESRVKRLSEQTGIFDRFTERANKIPDRAPRELIERAVALYNDIDDSHIKNPKGTGYISTLDANSDNDAYELGIIKNYTERQINLIIDMPYNFDFTGFIADRKIIAELNKPENYHYLTLILEPAKEQREYEQKQRAETSQNAPNSFEMAKTQNSSLESSKALESPVEAHNRPRNRFRL